MMAIMLLSFLQRNGYSILVLQITEAWYRTIIVLLNCVVSNKLPDPQLLVSHLHSLSLSLPLSQNIFKRIVICATLLRSTGKYLNEFDIWLYLKEFKCKNMKKSTRQQLSRRHKGQENSSMRISNDFFTNCDSKCIDAFEVNVDCTFSLTLKNGLNQKFRPFSVWKLLECWSFLTLTFFRSFSDRFSCVARKLFDSWWTARIKSEGFLQIMEIEYWFCLSGHKSSDCFIFRPFSDRA